MKIKHINPEGIFLTEPPVIIKNLKSREYYDKSEIGMRSYLQILPSVGLYGFKYAVVLDESNRVMDGNFRVYAGQELGIKIPCVAHTNNREGLPFIIYAFIWRIRNLMKIKYFLQRKFKNNKFKWKKIVLVCKFQKVILR